MDNIILITIDDLRSDRLGFMGYDKDTSPFLDKLAKKGVYLPNFFANAPYTTASISSLLTSTLPLVPDDYIPFGKSRTSLATILREKGVKTIGIHSNPWFPLYGYGKDFDLFMDPMKSNVSQNTNTSHLGSFKNLVNNIKSRLKYLDVKNFDNRIKRIGRILKIMKEAEMDSSSIPYANAEKINNSVIEKLRKQNDNFFLWIHYMDVHGPHFLRDKSSSEIKKKCLSTIGQIITSGKKYTSKEKELMNSLYDDDVRYIDKKIEELFKELSNICDLEKTTVIITADHGEELGEHGGFGHDDPIKLYDELLKIPLIIWNAKMDFDDKKALSSLMDISPTILDNLDIEKHPSYIGNSLFEEGVKRRSIISQGIQDEEYDPNQKGAFKNGVELSSYRTKNKKLIYSSDNKMELYDLATDPNETKNIVHSEKDTVKKMLNEFFSKIKSYQQTAEEYKLTEELKGLNV